MISDDIECIKGADFIYTDVWYGLYDEEVEGENYMDVFYPKYQVTMDMMNFAGPNSKFMHSTPTCGTACTTRRSRARTTWTSSTPSTRSPWT